MTALSDTIARAIPAPAAGSAPFDVRNPYTGEVIARLADASSDDVASAIARAEAAFAAWRATPAKRRGQYLAAVARLMHERKSAWAPILSAEAGKPIAEAVGEWNYAAGFFEWFAGQAERAAGQFLPPSTPGKRWVTLREPVGVAAAMTPWNFPIAMIAKKIPAALAAGCTVVARPSSRTPLSAVLLGRLLDEAGLPPGVAQIVTTLRPGPFVEPVFASKAVRVVSFTGSTEVGQELMRRAADTLKRVGLELGGNAPFIVFNDADMDAAVEGLIASKFRNAGQTCICPNRVFVQAGVHDAFVAKLAARVAKMTVGDPLAAGTEIGPLIDRAGYDKAAEHIRDAVARGARIVAGGLPRTDPGQFGCCIPPTVLTGVTPDAKLNCEETFGPLVPIATFDDEAGAIAAANDTDYGLAGYFYTRDVARAWRVADALQCGILGVNDGKPGLPEAPFGGVKFSGIGREGGPEGLDEYLQTKFISFGE
ncbi:MAG: Succinate-semialdehyde dehydrogenase [NADP(+)] GabD [Phycisphaerae bacterium]|nr:Succinate-semialdehyde dehydrogenase [NADP(+)] GabD [Phycisphaerae bacterium]